jgi:hypothetical protein
MRQVLEIEEGGMRHWGWDLERGMGALVLLDSCHLGGWKAWMMYAHLGEVVQFEDVLHVVHGL